MIFLNFMNGNCSKYYVNDTEVCSEFQDRLGCNSSNDACKIDFVEEKESFEFTALKNTKEVDWRQKMGLKKLFQTKKFSFVIFLCHPLVLSYYSIANNVVFTKGSRPNRHLKYSFVFRNVDDIVSSSHQQHDFPAHPPAPVWWYSSTLYHAFCFLMAIVVLDRETILQVLLEEH